jgi:hypothetical protein
VHALFDAVAPDEPVFRDVLARFHAGEPSAVGGVAVWLRRERIEGHVGDPETALDQGPLASHGRELLASLTED